MRALSGVLLELMALIVILYAASALYSSSPFSIIAMLFAQALTTILIHCPAHYIVGRALGISFSGLKLGRSTAAKALPESVKRIASLLVVFTLVVDPKSKRSVSPRRQRAMFLAGVSGSLGSAIIFAATLTLAGNYLAALIAWLFALAYLASDVKLSPVSGDLMRARAVMKPSV